jgi:hypothetical protein
MSFVTTCFGHTSPSSEYTAWAYTSTLTCCYCMSSCLRMYSCTFFMLFFMYCLHVVFLVRGFPRSGVCPWSGHLHVPAALLRRKEPPVPIELESGWAPEPVWTRSKSENSWPYRDSKSDPSVVQPAVSRYTDYTIILYIHCLYLIFMVLLVKWLKLCGAYRSLVRDFMSSVIIIIIIIIIICCKFEYTTEGANNCRDSRLGNEFHGTHLCLNNQQ